MPCDTSLHSGVIQNGVMKCEGTYIETVTNFVALNGSSMMICGNFLNETSLFSTSLTRHACRDEDSPLDRAATISRFTFNRSLRQYILLQSSSMQTWLINIVFSVCGRCMMTVNIMIYIRCFYGAYRSRINLSYVIQTYVVSLRGFVSWLCGCVNSDKAT